MNASPTALRHRLRAIAPDRAELQTALIAALTNRSVDDLHTAARVASARDRRAATAWILFATPHGPLAVAPLLVGGMLARMTDGGPEPDAAAAAATLGRVEPLVAALETVLGIALLPTGLARRIDDEAMLLLRFDGATARGELRDRLIVAVPPGVAVSPLPAPLRIPALVAHLRPRWTARIAGPVLPPHRAAALEVGGLILLGIGGPVAKLSLPGRNDVLRASVDWGNMALVITGDATGERILDGDDATNAGEGVETRPDWTAVGLPSTIEIEGAGLTAAELAAIGKGSVLPLPARGGTLAVRVRVGDMVMADGELVAIGDGFGVLVTGLRMSPQG